MALKPEVKAVLFTNWTNEDFIGEWDSVKYPIKAGQSMYMEDWKAANFAKHLTDRELNKLDMPTNHGDRDKFVAKCYEAAPAISVGTKAELDTALLNANKPEEVAVVEKKKGGRPKKVVAEAASDESSFEGLKE